MIALVSTATNVCYLALVDGEYRYETEWEANRELAKGLIAFIESELRGQDKDFKDLSGVGVFQGPGSFTGLRIGITVANTLADALSLPIVGEEGVDWQEKAIGRLNAGENDRIIMPLYGAEATITAPRK